MWRPGLPALLRGPVGTETAPFPPSPSSPASRHAVSRARAIGKRVVSPAIVLWICAFVAALALDRTVAQWVRHGGLDQKANWTPAHAQVAKLIKLGGTYPITLLAALAAGWFHPLRRRAAGFVALCGAASGLSVFIKWLVGRHRPVVGIDPMAIHPFAGGWPGMVGFEKNLCFPSGHACLASAAAAAPAMLFPRARYAFYAVAALVALERVSENAHYLSDVVAGAGFGVLVTFATARLLQVIAARRGIPLVLGADRA